MDTGIPMGMVRLVKQTAHLCNALANIRTRDVCVQYAANDDAVWEGRLLSVVVDAIAL